jgi:hypothetical protein
MSSVKYTTEEGIFYVDIVKPSQKEIDSYYKNTGEIQSSSSSADTPRTFQKAVIKSTWNEDLYPIDSIWMMGESPGMSVNFFGEKITMIQQKDLYARID